MKRVNFDRVRAGNQSFPTMTTESKHLVVRPSALVAWTGQFFTTTERRRNGQLDRTEAIPLQQLHD
jgi:hypothetical protein